MILAPWLTMILVAAAFRGPITRRALRNRWVTVVGGMAYSIYLVHWPILLLLERATRPLRVAGAASAVTWTALLYLPVVLVASVTLFVLVERPCMDPMWASRTRAVIMRWPGMLKRVSSSPDRVADTEAHQSVTD